MVSNPLVTVITPTYNRADFPPEAIEGVLAQTFGDFELIVVDDGSTDNSPEIIAGYETRDSRIRSFHQENQGQSIARNRALSEARGEFICFLDSDNYWPSEKLEQQITVFKAHPSVDVIYGDTITIDKESREKSRHKYDALFRAYSQMDAQG